MARQLIYGNDIIGFNPSSGIITAKGYVPLPKLLSITNSTINENIYSFADPNTTATISYDAVKHETTFNVSYNTVGMNTEDKLQIFYEKEDIEIAPSKHLLDPVGKLRVTNPQSLIDTDFEYGKQSTKWETVKLVNNIPTAYSQGNPDEALETISVKINAGNDYVTVETPVAHELVVGTVIEVTNLKDPKYEGLYIIRDVTDSTTFSYKVPFVSQDTVELETEFTSIYPGAFYTGSTIETLDVQTSTGAGSTFLVTTDNIPGIVENTKLFLKGSRATKKYNFQSPADVITQIPSNYQTTITSTGPTSAITKPSSTVYFAQLPIIEDDWIGYTEYHFPSSQVSISGTTAGTITIDRSAQIDRAATDVLYENDVLVYYTPRGNTHPGPGIGSYHTFKIVGVSYTGPQVITGLASTLPKNQYVSFKLSSTFVNTTLISIASTGTNDFGNHRFMKSSGGRIREVDGKGNVTFETNHGLNINDEIVICSRSTNTGLTTTRGNWSSSYYFKYKVLNVLDSKRIRISDKYNNRDFVGPERFACAVKVTAHPFANAVYLPPDSGFSTSKYVSAQQVRYTVGSQGNNGIPNNLDANTDYLVRPIQDSRGQYWYGLYKYRDADLSDQIKLTIKNPTNTFRAVGGFHRFSSQLILNDSFTIKITNPPRADLANNQKLTYSTTSTSAIGGLQGSTVYYAKTDDALIGGDRFRLANNTTSVDVRNYKFSGANRDTATFGLITGAAHTAGITRYSYMQISGFNGTPTENLMIKGLHQVLGINTSYYTYYYWNRRWRWRWRWRGRYYWYWWYYRYRVRRREPITFVSVFVPTVKNRQNVLFKSVPNSQTVKACGIVSFTNTGGIGTHSIFIDSDGAADDTYTVTQVTLNSFVFQSTVEVPEVVNSFSGGDNTRVGVNSNWIKIVNHKLADGTKITYDSTGFTPIGGLINGQDYFVRVLDGNHIGLSTDQDLAINRFNDIDNTDLIKFTGFGATNQHKLISKSIKGFITGKGTIGVNTESTFVSGDGTKFFTDFANGDVFRIWWKAGTTTGPGTYFESRIIQVKSDTSLKLEDEVEFTASTANYFVPTRLYALSDAKVLHRPFDGALQMNSGLIPNTQLIRQTRRYFRYQAGKGIQCSMAINFNPTFDIDSITIQGTVGVSTNLIVKTKFPHGLSTESPLDEEQKFQVLNLDYPVGLNTDYFIKEIIDDFRVRIQTPTPLIDPKIEGFPQYNIINWRDGLLKCGMFDDQNGFFFQFDGDQLNVVRRSNTQQIAGNVSVTRGNYLVRGENTKFRSQLGSSDKVIIRGQTYKVISIVDDNLMYIQPAYRGNTIDNVIISKVIDTIIPQSEWNIDRMDGTGYSGYKVDTNRVQMVYMDYSWYGAGSIRFGFKTQLGEIKYCHEFIHNNQFTEAYMRSGNLPVRYEIETLDDPFFAPSLYHWGVSVVMDGKYDQDRGYHFTADSKVLPFTNGGIANYGGSTPTGTTSIGSTQVTNVNKDEASVLAVGEYVTSSTSSTFEKDTRITAIEIDTSSTYNQYTDKYNIFVDKEALKSNSSAIYAYSGTAENVKRFIPLVSIRLAPSVDNSATGNLGYRDIINRMQIVLKSANILTSHDCEVELILNAKLIAEDEFEDVGSPSLCQLFRHDINDRYTGGQVVYSFRAQGGSTLNQTSLKRGLNGTTIDLDEVVVLGNSVLGGDGLYPDGPDVLTLAVKPIDTSLIRGSSPLIVSGRITWIETQA